MSRIVAPLFALLLLAGCANTQPVYNVDHHPMPEAARQLPVDRIGQLIMKAGERRRWAFQQAGTGHLVATQIDGRYNNWVHYLEGDIDAQLTTAGS